MKIYFIRHGQTQYNKDGRPTGQLDEELIEEGIREAEEVAKDLPSDFDLIYCSDLIRCKQTAEILNRNFGLPIIYDPRLRERDFGSLTGKPWDEWDTELRAADKNQQYDYRSFGGESVQDVKNRILSCVDDIQKNNKDKKILVSTHGGVIRLLHNVLKGDIHETIHNSSIHEFDFVD